MGEGDETLGSEECKSGLSREETAGTICSHLRKKRYEVKIETRDSEYCWGNMSWYGSLWRIKVKNINMRADRQA